MSKKLVIVAHPDLSVSRINSSLISSISGMDDVEVAKLYSKYPEEKLDIVAEQKLIEQFDSIILQFPMQWYSCPSLLKKWIDDVFTDGWAYGSRYVLEGKQLSIAVTTWSKASDYQKEGRYRRTLEELTSPFEVLAFRINMKYGKPFFISGVGDIDDDQLANYGRLYKEYLENI
ncbi:NAD(P)H-dependent oxidoreductase [Leeia sp. TBRC 13508]|uniref:NAD(P)H-dependent oxidoreductase n=1 Tax=Leeia speluncae TaxID=2884804 RepID=A0ABS8DA88_9NEIS|nr:NAD(P)H-dependent oxidoreductase [Leeia speluncae]MCB6185120.1 NAD(P)H-dependent oxidoreductase [Leeia speluncae]